MQTTYFITLRCIQGHHCSVSGCGSTLILDGNMKNHRDVCAAKEARYAEFNGLPVKVQTGCPNTPQLKSRYCPDHTPTSFKSSPTSDNADSLSTAISTSQSEDVQLAYIVGKRETRQNTLYQVQLLTHYCTSSAVPSFTHLLLIGSEDWSNKF